MFRLETETKTVAPVGPAFCRYRMWISWQADVHMVLGAYEPQVAEALRREIAPGNVCIDVGAHVGYYAILMARLSGKKGAVVAFEPIPVNFELLQRNIALNALANVRPDGLAVSERDGTLRLTLSCDEVLPKTASTCGFAVGERRKVIDVATCSLDSYLARTGNVPDLVLIDVEKAELAVLRGAQATLRTARPKLLIEIHGWEGPERDEVGRFLSGFGYQRTILGYRNREAFAFFRPSPQPIETKAQKVRPDGSGVTA